MSLERNKPETAATSTPPGASAAPSNESEADRAHDNDALVLPPLPRRQASPARLLPISSLFSLFSPLAGRRGLAVVLALVATLAITWSGSSLAGADAGSEPPAAPTGLKVTTEAGSLDVSVDWDDVDGASDYLLRWREVGPGNPLSEGVKVGVSETAITVDDFGEWVVRVEACNDGGCGKPAARRFMVEEANRAPVVDESTENHSIFVKSINAPRGVFVIKSFEGIFSDPDGDVLTYSVSVPADRVDLVELISVMRSNKGIGLQHDADGDWGAVAPALPNPLTTAVTVTATDPDGLSVSLTGPFHVAWESPPTPEPEPDESVPGQPTGLKITIEEGSLSVSVAWDTVEGADSYRVRWRLPAGGFEAANLVSAAATSASITVADYGQWVVRVEACNTAGCGRGIVQTVVVKQVSPMTVEGLAVSSGPGAMGLTATWDAVSDATSYKLRWRLVGESFEPEDQMVVSGAEATFRVSEAGRWMLRLEACKDDGCGPKVVQSFEVTTPCNNGVIVPNPDDKPELVADCEVLWAARDVLNPAGDILTSWNAQSALASWGGITIGGSPTRVTYLHFPHAKLSGSIPPVLGKLTGLIWLGLEATDLTGEVPSQIGNLTNLEELSFSYNRLTGSLPVSLSNLTNLWSIHVNNNQFTGPIPPEYGNLNTEHFHLSYNRLSGSIPPELANIDNLGGFFLHDNQLTGEIPDELKNADTIHTFAVENNQLSGELPSWLGTKEYWYLYVSNNQFTGAIPDLSGLPLVTGLKLGGNSLSGCIADSLRNQISTSYSSTAPYGDVGAPFCADVPKAPFQPSGLEVSTTAGSLEVSVNWDDVDDADSYQVRWREYGAGNPLNVGVEVTTSEAAITVADHGNWVVRVEACNEAGCGKHLAQRFRVEPAPEATAEQ